MPLVRISLRQGKPADFGKKIGAIVYQTMVDMINVPVHDNFQIIAEHNEDGLIYDPNIKTSFVLLKWFSFKLL